MVRYSAVASSEVCFSEIVYAVVHILFNLHVLRLANGGGAAASKVAVRHDVRAANVQVLGLFLTLGLPVVEVVEVGHDDGHGQRNGQHSGDGAQGPHDLTSDGDRVHVSVAHGGHRHHSPPERVRNAGEEGVGVIGFREEHGTGEEDDPDEEEEDEKTQLPHAGLEGLAQDLETLGVPGELEDAEDTDQPDDPKDGQRGGLFATHVALILLCQLRAQGDEVRDDGHDVDEIHDVLEELRFAGTGKEADDELEGEPDDAESLHDEERVGEDVGFVWHGGVAHLHHTLPVVLQLGQGLQAEDHDGDEDDHHRDDGDAPGRPRALGVLEQQPDLALVLVLGQRPLLLPDEAFVLAEFLHRLFAQFIELDLFREHLQRHIDGSAEPAARLVVIEDGVEAGPVPVEEILVAQRVEVAHPPLGVAQQRVGELGQGLQLGLEPQPRDVDDHPLAALVVVVGRGVGVLRVSGQSRRVVQVVARDHGHCGGRLPSVRRAEAEGGSGWVRFTGCRSPAIGHSEAGLTSEIGQGEV